MATRMDPQLFEELARGNNDAEIDAIIRLWPGREAPEQVRIVSRFGDIATCRMRRGDIIAVRRHPSTRSLKASRRLNNDRLAHEEVSEDRRANLRSLRDQRRPKVRETGQGVVIGVIDYGCDFAHRSFRNAEGQTRIAKLWDQRSDPGGEEAIEPYRRGRVFDREEINVALAQAEPYRALGYHPAPGSRAAAVAGAHGTHVLDIAAGNGRGDAASGMAPNADIVFVHVSSGDTDGLNNFGDSVGVIEAIDFINREAGERPCVINISMGRHGGPHDGSTLAEKAIDSLLKSRRGLSLVQSAGNYFGRAIHASGHFAEGEIEELGWRVRDTQRHGTELEVWYSGKDALRAHIEDPDRTIAVTLEPGQRKEIRDQRGALLGRAYARIGDPGNSDNHIDIFLYRGAPPGEWSVTLEALRIEDGKWHAWIERTGTIKQATFSRGPVNDAVTCGTIAHGRGAIQVSAHNGASQPRLTSFSSAGPARDGRLVPLIAAPGLRIRAARSAVPGRRMTHREATRKSGTSMAAPYVTGLVALMYEAAPDASQRVIRSLLKRSAEPLADSDREGLGARWGAVDAEGAIRLARRWQTERAKPGENTPDCNRDAQCTSCASCAQTSMKGENTMLYQDQSTMLSPPVTRREWMIIANWIARGLVPTDGSGAFPSNRSPAKAAALPSTPTAAASAIARALTAHSTSMSSGLRARSSSRQALRMLAGAILPAVPPSASEWRMLGEFMERQTTLNRTSSRTRSLFGTNDAANRRDMAHFLACGRLRSTFGSTLGANYCSFPTNTSGPAIQILAQKLSVVGPLLDWPQMSLDARRVHVMDRLVRVYGYGREAAAGIVGNLEAESGVIPERVEGSRRANPRYARGWDGKRSRHNAIDIQNRSSRRRRGPRKPGIGLAQWTSRGRRNRFFAFSHVGVAPGEFIIYFMDHQIAYLVDELATRYRRLNRLLRRPGTSLNDAADGVVYDFERPGSVLEPNPNRPGKKRRRSRSDPQVQRIFQERRRRARGALRAYDAAYPRSNAQPAEPAPATAS